MQHVDGGEPGADDEHLFVAPDPADRTVGPGVADDMGRPQDLARDGVRRSRELVAGGQHDGVGCDERPVGELHPVLRRGDGRGALQPYLAVRAGDRSTEAILDVLAEEPARQERPLRHELALLGRPLDEVVRAIGEQAHAFGRDVQPEGGIGGAVCRAAPEPLATLHDGDAEVLRGSLQELDRQRGARCTAADDDDVTSLVAGGRLIDGQGGRVSVQ